MRKILYSLLAWATLATAAHAQVTPSSIDRQLTGRHTMTGQYNSPPCPLTYASPLASSASACALGSSYGVQGQAVTLTGNTTWQKPSGLLDGQTMYFDFLQDATSGRQLTLPNDGSIWVPSTVRTGSKINLTQTSGAMDRAICNGAGGTAPTFVSTRMVCSGWVFDIGAPSIALVAHTASARQNVASPAINTSGANLLVAVVTLDQSTSTSSPPLTDSAGNTWTACGTPQNDNATKVAIYYSYAPTTSASHTFTNTTFVGAGEYSAWSAVAAAPCDQSAGATTASTTSLQAGSITPLAGSLIIAGIAGGALDTFSITSPFVLLDQNPFVGSANWSGGAAYLVQSSSAAVNPTWSWPTSGHAAAMIVSFK